MFQKEQSAPTRTDRKPPAAYPRSAGPAGPPSLLSGRPPTAIPTWSLHLGLRKSQRVWAYDAFGLWAQAGLGLLWVEGWFRV